MGHKIDFEDMEVGTRYSAYLPYKKGSVLVARKISGVFEGVYEPGSDGVRTPSAKPYIIFKAVNNDDGIDNSARYIYMHDVTHDKFKELHPYHDAYINPSHPEREVYLPSALWRFYPIPHVGI